MHGFNADPTSTCVVPLESCVSGLPKDTRTTAAAHNWSIKHFLATAQSSPTTCSILSFYPSTPISPRRQNQNPVEWAPSRCCSGCRHRCCRAASSISLRDLAHSPSISSIRLTDLFHWYNDLCVEYRQDLCGVRMSWLNISAICRSVVFP